MSENAWSVEPGKGIGVLELGKPRDDVFRALAGVGYKAEEDDDEGRWYFVAEMDAAIQFTEGANPVLEEIAVGDERLRLGPIKVIDEPLREIVELLKIADEETVWTHRQEDHPDDDDDDDDSSDDLSDDSSEDAEGNSAGDALVKPPSSEKLLAQGILWVRPFGLGLELLYGDVVTVRLRRPGDLPEAGYGPLTPEQRALAARPELTSHLNRAVGEERRCGGRFQLFAFLALMVAMALVIWRAIDY